MAHAFAQLFHFAGQPESGTSLLDERPMPGTPVTLKVVIVHYAAKGLYPVIKPRELKSALGAWVDIRADKSVRVSSQANEAMEHLMGRVMNAWDADEGVFAPSMDKSEVKSILEQAEEV